MAIQSKHTKDPSPRVIDQSNTDMIEQDFEQSLRPKMLDEYVGQEALKKQLTVAIQSAKIRWESLEHILFYGPPGLGKTTLSMIIAHEMWWQIKHTSGPAIDKQSDIISILTGLQEGDILFIDEIHRLKPVIEETLYGAMEDYKIDIILGTGPWATSVRMDLPRFTLVGATTRLSAVSNPLRDRFGNVMKLDMYTQDDLGRIASRTSKILECHMTPDVTVCVAKRSRGTPRVTNRLVKILRDYMTIWHSVSNEHEAESIFAELGIDDLWLDEMDRKLLKHMRESFAGWPVGINTLASVLWEEESTIEDVIEPYLLKIGLIERTPRGRKLTPKADQYLGLDSAHAWYQTRLS